MKMVTRVQRSSMLKREKKEKLNTLNKRFVSGVLLAGVINGAGVSVYAMQREGGEELINAKREYWGYKPIEERDIPGIGKYIRFPDLVRNWDQENKIAKEDMKYLVIHETAVYSAGARATNFYSSYNQEKPSDLIASTKFVIDDNTLVQTMPVDGVEYALGERYKDKASRELLRPDLSDLTRYNSVSVEMCVNEDGNYNRTVANTVFFAREFFKEYPNAELKQHADAWSEYAHGNSYQKDCPKVLRSESGTWWTWDKLVYFAKNPDLPIPFIDFDPNNTNSIPNNKKLRDYLGVKVEAVEAKEGIEEEKSESKEEKNTFELKVRESEDVKEDVKEEIKEKGIDENVNVDAKEEVKEEVKEDVKEEIKDEEVKENNKEKYELASSDKFTLKLINSDDVESELLSIDRYVDFDVDANLEFIKKNSQGMSYSESQVRAILDKINLICRAERFNPNIAVQFMNGYTGYLSFQGSVKPEDNNFGGLRDKNGELLKYDTMEEGVVAYVQYLKSMTSKDRLLLPSRNKSALKTVKRGVVSDISDFVQALDVDNDFVESAIDRIKSIKK